MVLQHNISALNAHRNLGVNNSQTSGNLEKLSSGYRINRASDDAAGLAISEKMRGQIRGLSMASQNTENGVSLIKTAEGGLNETHSVLQRMRELAVQSSNGTFQDEDREQIAKELNALKGEIDRISSSTHFNGIKLLDGSVGGDKGIKIPPTITPFSVEGSTTALALKLKELGFVIEVDSADGSVPGRADLRSHYAGFDGESANLIITAGKETGDGNAQVAMQVGDKTYMGVVMPLSLATALDGADGDSLNLATGMESAGYNGDAYVFYNENNEVVASLAIREMAATYNPLDSNGISGVITNIKLANKDPNLLHSTALVTSGNSTASANSPISTTHPLYGAMLATETSALSFQIGANGAADQRVGLAVRNLGCAGLGDFIATSTNPTGTILDMSVATRDAANEAIDVIDKATQQVSSTRAGLGALQNRLEHTLNNLGVTKENLQAAESSIRDVDMAKEMMEFTKNNILVQASQSMLAQANSLPQGVLSLFK